MDIGSNYEIKNQLEYDLYAGRELYVRKNEGENISESIWTRNFNKLSESKKEIISQKYTCSICLELIKNEKPYFCYVCQKIFHYKCLENWEKQQNESDNTLSCPNCRNKLPLKDWKEKRDFEDIRLNDANIMSKMNEGFINNNQYIEKSNKSFEKILIQLNEIYTLINSEENQKIKDLINRLKSYITKPSTDDITYEILEQLKFIKNYIKCTNNYANNNKKEVNLQYVTKEEGIHNIFGQQFVIANANNITLIINGKPTELVDKYVLLKGKNIVKMIIKNDITILDYMFSECKSLVNIDELQYLDTTGVTNYENMFHYCNSLSDIRALYYWDVSQGTNFKGMFSNCKSLNDISPLINWNVSNATSLAEMFSFCRSLSDLTPLQLWNVSNNNSYDFMFYATLVKDIKPLGNWNVSNGQNFSGMFCSCSSLRDLRPLENWNVSNATNFQGMFSNCKLLSDVEPLKDWKVSNGNNFSGMFFCCDSLSDVEPLQNWKVTNTANFSNMFGNCSQLSDLSPLKKWNLSDQSFEYLTKSNFDS